MINLKTSDKIMTTFGNISDNNYKAIDIEDTIATDKLEYDSYEEAAVTAEMLSLQNVIVKKHGDKYKLVSCSGAMDCSKKHLKIGDKVHYGLFHTWEIVDIGRDNQHSNILGITLKSKECEEYVWESVDEKGQCIFYQLKAGKIDGIYVVCLILTRILKHLEAMDDTFQERLVLLTATFLSGLLGVVIGLLIMNVLKGG